MGVHPKDGIHPKDGYESLNGSYCGKKLYESQGQASAQIFGASAQSVFALRTFARILPEISALPPLFPLACTGRGNTRSNQIELVSTIYDMQLTMRERDLSSSIVKF
jgi:hypothetical protein